MTRLSATHAADKDRATVLVLGGGVIGITAAHKLLECGYRVVLIARESAHTIQSTEFASPWAGAVWFPFSDEHQGRQSEWERATFQKWTQIKTGADRLRLSSLSIDFPDSVLALVPFQRQERARKAISPDDSPLAEDNKLPWWSSVVHDFRSSNGRTECKTYSLDSPSYLTLMQQAAEKHPRFTLLQAEAGSLAHACAIAGRHIDCVINATGLGAAHLADVLDAEVEPIGGQLVRLQAVDEQMTSKAVFIDNDEDDDKLAAKSQATQLIDGQTTSSLKTIERLYVIPRALSGELVLGGTEQYGSFNVTASPQQSRRIIDAVTEACPWLRIADRGQEPRKLAGSVLGNERSDDGAMNTYRILGATVGLRPSRKGGPRLEIDDHGIALFPPSDYESSGDSDQTSLGSADIALGSNGTALNSPGAANGRTRAAGVRPIRDGPLPSALNSSKSNIPVVHAYGFGKTGYQVSWGVAAEIARLVESQIGAA